MDDESMACRVCRLVLNRYRDLGDNTVEYRHSRPWVDQDHEPEPVPAGSVDALLSCDFCPTNAPAVWNYHGEEIRNFRDARGGRNDFSANWTACRRCDELLQRGDLDGLLERVFKLLGRRDGPIPPAVRADRTEWVLKLWRTFLATVRDRTPIVDKAPPPPPAASVLTPQKLPKIRAAAARYWRTVMPPLLLDHNSHRAANATIAVPGADVGRDGFAYQMTELNREQAEAFTHRIAFALDAATLYWVSETFTDLAVHAAADLPDITVAPADLPARHGLLVWARPAMSLPDPVGDVVAVSWATVPDGIWMVGYTQAEVAIGRARPDKVMDLQLLREQVGWLLPTAPGGGAQFDHPIPVDPDDDALRLLAILSATWLLMAQDGIAEQTPVELDRKERKAHARKHPGTPLPSVRLVDLRRRPHAAPTGPAGERAARVYTVRWIVRGFWKDQPYGPQRSLRKRIYIAPHLAGPEGRPLKPTTPVVQVLR